LFKEVATMSAEARVEAALREIRRGRMVLVVDDEDRENEGDLIMAAEMATPEAMAFMIRHSSGILCVAITPERAEELRLPLMVDHGDDPRGTAFTVSVDLKAGTTTGVSGADRALTVRALANAATRPTDLCRPGHVFPLIARPGGVLQRAGHTESSVDLCRLAGLEPAGVLAEITNDDGTMARRPELRGFAIEHGLVLLSVADLVRFRERRGALVRREAAGRVPVAHGGFTAVSFLSVADDAEHVALVLGDVERAEEPVPVHVHRECLAGDVFGSRRCGCGRELNDALARIGANGLGVVVYLRGREGYGAGQCHTRPDRDVARNEVAAQMLDALGVRRACRPDDPPGLARLAAPRVRAGHLLPESEVS
jgi:3,4-dihydroxy 2-butanone 4-phosphate synthase/GTP cyclohydrolase II